MRILVLGGTSFVGRAIVDDALREGHEVTLFNRGRTDPELFSRTKRLLGDRDEGDYSALEEGTWDAVVDVSGSVPRHVQQAADTLGDRVGRYLFVSSNAVYAPGAGLWANESAPVRRPEWATERVGRDTYGPLKAACEQEVISRYGDRATIVRPGILAGPHDNVNQFTYWVRRAARGGKVVLPGDPGQPVQILDVRDLARLVVRLLVDDRGGAFNAMGPIEPLTLIEMVRTCVRAAGSDVDLVLVPPEAIMATFPLVRSDRVWEQSFQRDFTKSLEAGLPVTPLLTTAVDVLAWDRERGEPPLDVGPSAEIERTLLSYVQR